MFAMVTAIGTHVSSAINLRFREAMSQHGLHKKELNVAVTAAMLAFVERLSESDREALIAEAANQLRRERTEQDESALVRRAERAGREAADEALREQKPPRRKWAAG